MDPVQTAFLMDLLVYLIAGSLVFTAGYAAGQAGKARAARLAADKAWRISEAMRRHTPNS